jgi:iron complex outermembrane receptor protein
VDPATVRQLEGDTAQHKILLQSFFTLPKDFELDLAFRYVSSVPNQNVPSYSTGDVRFGKRLSEHFSLDLVGRNLLQPSHPEYGGGAPGQLIGIRLGGYLRLTWTR